MAISGPVSKSLDHLRNTLADAEAFQTFTGTATRAAALLKIHLGAMPEPADQRRYTVAELNALRPYALIWVDESGGGFRADRAADGTFFDSGRIKCQLVRQTPAGEVNDPAEADNTFLNAIGDIIDDLYALVEAATTATYSYLAISAIVFDQGPGRLDPDVAVGMGDAQGVELGFVWGAQRGD